MQLAVYIYIFLMRRSGDEFPWHHRLAFVLSANRNGLTTSVPLNWVYDADTNDMELREVKKGTDTWRQRKDAEGKLRTEAFILSIESMKASVCMFSLHSSHS